MSIPCFKGFNKDLKCTPGGKEFPYALGGEYEEPSVSVCNHGFHSCENPLDVFTYYPPTNGNRYAEVEADGQIEKHDDDSKVASSRIKIGIELNLKAMIQAGIKFIFEKTTSSKDTTATTGYGANAAIGHRDAIAAAIGIDNKAKGVLGGWLVLAEWERDDSWDWHVKGVRAVQVDGGKIKANVFYQLKNGEFVEAE